MNNDTTPREQDHDPPREAWSSPLHTEGGAVNEQVRHPRADGEDPDFEALEMEHRGISSQR